MLLRALNRRAAALCAAIAWVVVWWPTTAAAQSSPSDYTYATRYDAAHRVTGTIAPDPDGSGPVHYAAVRNTYDAAGDLTRVETGELSSWQSESVAPAAWTGFTVFAQVDTTYDALNRKLTETTSSGGTAYALTQYSYDNLGRLDCVAVRMNTAAYGSLPTSACTATTAGSFGPDRITRNVYDAAGHVLRVQQAYGTSLQQDEATSTYSANGKPLTVKDANGNLAGYTYDGFDRVVKWAFPSPTATGTISTTDYEAYTYDANGNRLSLRKRDTSVIGYSYDALNRMTVKDMPGGTASDVYYGYDLRGLQTFARFASSVGAGLTNTFDGFGRLASTSNDMSGSARTLSYQYDADGNRTRMTYPDGHWNDASFDGLDRWNYTNIDSSLFLASIAIDQQGRASVIYRGAGATTYNYDAVSRVTLVSHQYNSGPSDVVETFAYSPASQITSKSRYNDAYAYPGYVSASQAYAANGLNQYNSIAGTSVTYDANGNLTGDGSNTYIYDVENRLISKSGGISLSYDPMGRLFQISGGPSGTTQFLYDGDRLVMEYDGSGNILRRYVHGPGQDDPYVWFEGSSVATSAQRYLFPDRSGSIVGIGDLSGSGTRIAINSYDDYGNPNSTNAGRFQYTGQVWLPDLGLYYYKARIYSPALGRFLQADPIGYADQINLYAYVGNDPVNASDPDGMIMANGGAPNLWVDPRCPPGTPAGEICIHGGCDQVCRMKWALVRQQISRLRRMAIPFLIPRAPQKPNTPARRSVPCDSLLDDPGHIAVGGITATAVVGGGVTGGYGKFRNLKTGATGSYFTAGGAVGYEVSGSGAGTIYNSLSDLAGFGANINLQIGNLTASFNFNTSGLVSTSVGAAAPGSPAGASAGAGGTHLFACSVPAG